MQAIKPLITSPTILGASREIQCFLQIRTFGDGQAFYRWRKQCTAFMIFLQAYSFWASS
jgi:hypothetical protein